jgi:hypothetical protein
MKHTRCELSPAWTHTRTRTHTMRAHQHGQRAHTHMHMHTHARTHTHTPHPHARTRCELSPAWRAGTHAHAHAYTHTHTHAHARTHTMRALTSMESRHTCTCTCIHAHAHTRTRTRTRTHTQLTSMESRRVRTKPLAGPPSFATPQACHARWARAIVAHAGANPSGRKHRGRAKSPYGPVPPLGPPRVSSHRRRSDPKGHGRIQTTALLVGNMHASTHPPTHAHMNTLVSSKSGSESIRILSPTARSFPQASITYLWTTHQGGESEWVDDLEGGWLDTYSPSIRIRRLHTRD